MVASNYSYKPQFLLWYLRCEISWSECTRDYRRNLDFFSSAKIRKVIFVLRTITLNKMQCASYIPFVKIIYYGFLAISMAEQGFYWFSKKYKLQGGHCKNIKMWGAKSNFLNYIRRSHVGVQGGSGLEAIVSAPSRIVLVGPTPVNCKTSAIAERRVQHTKPVTLTSLRLDIFYFGQIN